MQMGDLVGSMTFGVGGFAVLADEMLKFSEEENPGMAPLKE